jgi:hypothetical protein
MMEASPGTKTFREDDPASEGVTRTTKTVRTIVQFLLLLLLLLLRLLPLGPSPHQCRPLDNCGPLDKKIQSLTAMEAACLG